MRAHGIAMATLGYGPRMNFIGPASPRGGHDTGVAIRCKRNRVSIARVRAELRIPIA